MTHFKRTVHCTVPFQFWVLALLHCTTSFLGIKACFKYVLWLRRTKNKQHRIRYAHGGWLMTLMTNDKSAGWHYALSLTLMIVEVEVCFGLKMLMLTADIQQEGSCPKWKSVVKIKQQVVSGHLCPLTHSWCRNTRAVQTSELCESGQQCFDSASRKLWIYCFCDCVSSFPLRCHPPSRLSCRAETVKEKH